MINLAKSDPAIAIRPSDFDADRWPLTVRNGTLDLHTGQLQPHNACIHGRSVQLEVNTRDGTLEKLLPFRAAPEVCPHGTGKANYAPGGTPLGFRSLAAAERLIHGGFVKASYGRKGHLKAIWLQKHDGGSPVLAHVQTGTPYSFQENLDNGGRRW